MYIIDYLKSDGIFLKLKKNKKFKIIEELIQNGAKKGLIPEASIQPILEEIVERERQVTTGIGNCVAIPHCKSEHIDKAVILAATIPEGIKYDAMDNKPVKLIFMFLFPKTESTQYLQVLAKVSRLLKDENIRNKLILSENTEEFRKIVAENDIIPIEEGGEKGKYIFILSINDPKKESAVISSLLEIGAQTTLIIDSETLEKKMAYDIPLFAGLTYFKGKNPYSKTFIGIINNVAKIDYLTTLLKDAGIDLQEAGAGFLISFEAIKIVGGIPAEIDI